MDRFVEKLETLREYINLKVDWDINWPMMSFETYLEYKKEDPNILHWLRLLLTQTIRASKETQKTMDIFNQTGNLINRSNYDRGLANLSLNDALRHYQNQGIAHQQRKNTQMAGTGYSLLSIFGNISGLPFPFSNPFNEH